MQIAFHIGAHCTDEDQLLKSLLKNPQVFIEHGVAVPGPSKYRNLMRDVVINLAKGRASPESQDAVLEEILEGTDPDRLVMSFEQFICGAKRVLEDGILYKIAGEKTQRLRNTFPDHQVEFWMSLRNPASFIPALLTKFPDLDREATMAELNLEGLVWSDVIRDIREANPDSPIYVWCNEDTPLLWLELMHEITGIDLGVPFKGGLDIISQIMEREGMKRLRAYMAEHPIANEMQRRRVLTAFLDKYAIDDAVEEEILLPGWTDEIMDELTAAYDDDMLEIKRIPGVTLISV